MEVFVLMPFLQMKKIRLTEDTSLTQCRTVGRWHHQGWPSGLSALTPVLKPLKQVVTSIHPFQLITGGTF